MNDLKNAWQALNGERIVIAVITVFSTIGIGLMTWMLTTLWEVNGTVKEMSGNIASISRSDADQAHTLKTHTESLLDHEKRLIILEIRAAAERERETNRTRKQ